MENDIGKLRSFFECVQDSSEGKQHAVVCPLSIAVTGHRHIEEKYKSGTKSKIRSFLEETIRVWEHKTAKAPHLNAAMVPRIPILVLTGMAEGADQWVAETVLEMKSEDTNSPLRLISVLPMPLDEYVNDFSETSAEGASPREVFQQLLGQSDHVLTLDYTRESELLVEEVKALREEAKDALEEPRKEVDEKIKQKMKEYRRNQYRALGEYLVSHGFIILALWDGMNDITYDSDPLKIQYGGTEDVVRMKMEGTPAYSLFTGELFADASIQPFGSVYQIVVPKSNRSALPENHRSFHAPNGTFPGSKENNVLKTFMLEPKSCEKKNLNAQSWVDNVAICQTTPRWFYTNSILVQISRCFRQTRFMTGKLLSDGWADICHKPRRDESEFQKVYPTTNTGVSLKIMRELNQDILTYQPEITARFARTENSLFPGESKKVNKKRTSWFVWIIRMCITCVLLLFRSRTQNTENDKIVNDTENVKQEETAVPEVNPDIAVLRGTKNYPFLFQIYAAFDYLAWEYQRCFHLMAYVFMALMFVGAVMVSIKIPVIYYVVCAALLFLCAWERCVLKFYAKYRRYRTVAEVLRIQIFWDQAKIGISAIDNYWNHQIPELNWLRMVLKSFMIPLEKQDQFNEKIVQKYWIEGQCSYFSSKFKQKRRADIWCRVLSIAFILLGVIWYGQTVLSGSSLQTVQSMDAAQNHYEIWYGILSFGLPLGTIVIFYGRVKGFRRDANNCAKILPIYHQALSAIRKMSHFPGYPNETQLQEMFLSLGEYALNENVDWHLLPNELKFTK